MPDPLPTLQYEQNPRRPTRWPWVVMAIIAIGSCAAYGCYFAGLMSFGVMVVTIELVVCGVLAVAGIAAGIRYGTQKKDYWI